MQRSAPRLHEGETLVDLLGRKRVKISALLLGERRQCHELRVHR